MPSTELTAIGLDDLSLVAGVVGVVIWLLLLLVVRWVTRKRPTVAGPKIQELPGDEPPAVVAYITQGLTITQDAAESTLIDLAARGFIELRQSGNDPRHTTIHIPNGGPDDSLLLAHELRVLNRVRRTASGAVVPLDALRGRIGTNWKTWQRRFDAEVVAEARARGLTEPGPVNSPWQWALMVMAWWPTFLLLYRHLELPVSIGLAAAAGSFAGVIGFTLLRSERDTPAGRHAASRWLGLRAFMIGDESFAAQPPAAVVLWDRLLAYGDALGVTQVIQEVVDFGEADRSRIWSSYGGTWRQVKVHYPTFGPKGTSPGRMIRNQLVLPALLVFGWYVLSRPDRTRVSLTIGDWQPWVADPDAIPVDIPPAAAGAGAVVVLLLLARSTWIIVRAVGDLVGHPEEVTGEVLWKSQWVVESNDNNKRKTISYYLPVDDGRSDQTTAWSLRVGQDRGIRPHDIVRLTGRPWTRRLISIEVVERRNQPGELIPSAAPLTGRWAERYQQLLGVTTRTDRYGGKVTVFKGLAAQMIAGNAFADQNHEQLPGLGDKAFVASDIAVAYQGEKLVIINQSGIGSQNPQEIAHRLAEELANLG